MTFCIKEGNFRIDNKKVFLISGEIHYFRIRRGLWDRHLNSAREAGLAAVSTYVPWAWHEPEEGVFDFDGTSCPERDLEGWLHCCRDHGLHCIVKPGPFILAETRGAGLPGWFLDKNADEVRMRNRKGEVVRSDGVNLFNPKYLEKVELWYDRVMPLISKWEMSAGGPVIMMQVCNEIGVFSWLAHQGDYSGSVRERFVTYLSKKFICIDELNSLWGTHYAGFADVELPPDGLLPFTSPGDRSRDYEWHCFWRTYYGDYLRMLAGMARKRGVTVPLYHNLPGWIYGHGYEFPVNITMYEDLFGDKSEILFGVDHIPEFVSYRNMHDDRIINDITRAMQGDRPLFAAEFQSGSREYHVVTNSREMELFYKASIANGLTGWNYYMFSQGRNPRHRGYSGSTFYWFTPLTPEGERTATFPLVRRMSQIIQTSGNIIVEAHRKAEICVLFYPPYYATELERPEEGAAGLQFSFADIRRPAYFDGLLKALQVLNIDYDMADLVQASAESLSRYRQVWVFCTDEMNARDQQVIVDYTRAGGHIVIFPSLPNREMSQRSCTIIRDSISIYPSGQEFIDSPLVDILGMEDIKCANPQVTYDEALLSGAEVIARTMSGAACGFARALGKGTLTHLGTWIGFDTEGHKPVYEGLLKRSGAVLRQAWTSNDNITVRERFTKVGSAILFIGNYYNEEHTVKVTYAHPETGKTVTIPCTRDEMVFPALYGVLTPICLPAMDRLKILHSTSDLLEVLVADGLLAITLIGDRDMPGEIVFEGEDALRIASATIDGRQQEMFRVDGRLAVAYKHRHKEEIVLHVGMA
jgi:beta-galactosidase